MTKQELMGVLDMYEDDEDIDINDIMRDAELARLETIERLEEEQHASGFYAFQDAMFLWRHER